MRWKPHVRFGRRAAETDPAKAGHRAAARPHTYVPTWAGMAFTAFVSDAFSRRILGWRTARHMRTQLVLDALEHALWTRHQAGRPIDPGLVCHSDAGSQYVSLACTERLAAAGAVPSVGSVGDAFDNALAETTIGLFKTELFKPRGPWRTAEQVEIAVLEWVDWYNHRRPARALRRHPTRRTRGNPLPSHHRPHRGRIVNELSLRTPRGGSTISGDLTRRALSVP
jgi:putative transposase